jgi:hypothetical protein
MGGIMERVAAKTKEGMEAYQGTRNPLQHVRAWIGPNHISLTARQCSPSGTSKRASRFNRPRGLVSPRCALFKNSSPRLVVVPVFSHSHVRQAVEEFKREQAQAAKDIQSKVEEVRAHPSLLVSQFWSIAVSFATSPVL